MRRVVIEDRWPESWRYSYPYDLEEIYGPPTDLGYAYAYQNRCRHTVGLLTSALPRGARVLDIAAAQGNFSLLLAEMGYDITWNDIRADLIDYVRLKHERGDVCFVPGNAFELNFPFLFDAVLISEVIEHVAHPDEFLAKAASLIRVGGYVVMTTPNGAYFRNALPKFSDCPDPSVYETRQFKPNADGHIFLLHPDEILSLAARAGLKVEAFTLFTNPLTAGRLRTQFALRVLPQWFVETAEALTQNIPQRLVRKVFSHMGVRFCKV